MRLSSSIKADILRCLYEFEHPKRKALTHRFPILRPFVVPLRRSLRNWSNIFDPQVFTDRQKDWMPCIVARHQSVLRRKLGDSDARLQEQKVTTNFAPVLYKIDTKYIRTNKFKVIDLTK
jgi:hypothetical protein